MDVVRATVNDRVANNAFGRTSNSYRTEAFLCPGLDSRSWLRFGSDAASNMASMSTWLSAFGFSASGFRFCLRHGIGIGSGFFIFLLAIWIPTSNTRHT